MAACWNSHLLYAVVAGHPPRHPLSQAGYGNLGRCQRSDLLSWQELYDVCHGYPPRESITVVGACVEYKYS